VALAADARCGAVAELPGCPADAPLRYVAYATGVPERPFRCDGVGTGHCPQGGFVSLQACLAACDPSASSTAATCSQPSGSHLCDPSMSARYARLEATTPLGVLSFSSARLDHYTGFLESMFVVFSEAPSSDSGRYVSVVLTPPDSHTSVIGMQLADATVSLCDSHFSFPVEVTITVDRVSLGSAGDEHFEGSIHSLAPDIALEGEFRFEQVCYHGISD
jgi:hypothetical protein